MRLSSCKCVTLQGMCFFTAAWKPDQGCCRGLQVQEVVEVQDESDKVGEAEFEKMEAQLSA